VTAGLVFLATSLGMPGVGVFAPPEQAHAAEARGQKRVALFVVPRRRAADGEAKALQSLMRETLWRLDRIVAVGAHRDPAIPIGREIGGLVEQGFRALNDRQGEEAERIFRQAYDRVVTFDGPFERRLMARILKGLGVASVMTGQETYGEQMMGASLNLWPDQQVGEYGWTLDTRTAFRETERLRGEQALGAVDISTDPEGAEVRVGGELRGFSPLEVQGLAPGLHWVEVTLDGYSRTSQFVAVPPGESSIAFMALDPLPDKRTVDAALANVARLIRSPQVGAPLSNLQSLTSADVVIALELERTRTSFELQGWIRSGSASAERLQGTFPDDGALLDNFRVFLGDALGVGEAPDETILGLDSPPAASVMDDDLYIDPNDPIFQSERRVERESITDTWWFWAIAGGLTAGLVVGGILLFSADSTGSGPVGNVVIDLHRLP